MIKTGFLRDYAVVASGSISRLAIALTYFLIAANLLSLSDFGLFATASALGVVLSRVSGLGFISPLFRAATVRPQLTGTYLAGYFAALALSLPLVAALAALARLFVFEEMALGPFILIVAAEVLGWRCLELVAIVNNGMRRFGRATTTVLAGAGVRTVAAILFWGLGHSSLEAWAWTYLAANLAAACLAFALFMPPVRLRFAPRLYRAQLRDALPAALADVTFYLQAELDKAVVLAMAGPRAAGLYAIAMRIIDLTAVPIRSFNQLAMQKVMVDRRVALAPPMLALVELGIAMVSTGALAAAIALLWWNPIILGRNIGSAAALFPLLLAVPALRNLVEYHAELLYGMKRTGARALLLLAVAALKGALIWATLGLMGVDPDRAGAPQDLDWAPWLNLAFLAVYALSAVVTYGLVSAERRRA